MSATIPRKPVALISLLLVGVLLLFVLRSFGDTERPASESDEKIDLPAKSPTTNAYPPGFDSSGRPLNPLGENTNSSNSGAVVAEPIDPDDSSFDNSPVQSLATPPDNPFTDQNGAPNSAAPTTTGPTQPSVPIPPLSAPPDPPVDDFAQTGIPPDCSVRMVNYRQKGEDRRIVQIAVRNNVRVVWIKANVGMKEQIQGLPVTNHYAETTLSLTGLPVEIQVFGSALFEAGSMGCSTRVDL